MTVGESKLTGKLDLKTSAKPPRLDVELVAKTIQLDDFDTGDWSATEEGGKPTDKGQMPDENEGGGKPAAGGRSLLSPQVMRSVSGRMDVRVDEVVSGQDHLGVGTLTAALEHGRFSVDPLNLEVPGGSVDVSFMLEPTERDVALEMSAEVEKLDYGILARRIDPKSETGGIISVDLDLKT